MDKTPSCYVIGGDALVFECVEILRNRNFVVRGLISNNHRIEQAARQADIPFLHQDSDLYIEMSKEPFDYLFAFAGVEEIDDRVVRLPNKSSVGFHNGPLPQYAGFNCPAWALMNGEGQYGITWYQIAAVAEQGELLLQDCFRISSDETSLSLNIKCFVAALNTFPVLLDGLLDNTLGSTAQDLSKHSYFSEYRRPEAACVIDWSMNSSAIDARIRALETGNHTNPIGSMKLLIDNTACIVLSAESADLESCPGKVIECDEGVLSIGTGDGALRITELQTLTGKHLSISEFVEKHSISKGIVLPFLESEARDRLTSLDEKLCRSEEFWTQRLAQLEPAEAPFSYNRISESANPEFDSLDFRLDFDLSNIETVICAYLVLLARINDKDRFDVCYSSAALRRELTGFEAMASPGPVLRADFDLNADLGKALNAVKEDLNLVRSNTTWLNDLISRQPVLHGKAELHENTVVPIGIATEVDSAPFSPDDHSLVTLVISEKGANVRLVFDHNRLSVESIKRMQEQLQSIHVSVLNNPDYRVSDLSLLTDSEYTKIIQDWNRTDIEFPGQACIHQLFEEQVAHSPERVALVFEDKELTYRQLNQQANRLAHELVKNGVGPGVLVGVYIERSLDLMIATLGILKASGAYVPLDPAFPADRIQYMIEDAEMPIILCQHELASKLPPHNSKILVINDDTLYALPLPEQSPVNNADSSDLAYVIYTSGSTGRPKGVMVEHRNVVNFFTGMDKCVNHDEPGTWLAVTSLSFDISVLELFWTLSRGFKVVIYVDRDRNAQPSNTVSDRVMRRPMAFGLFMWGNDDAPGREKYKLMLEGSRYFDENGFDSVWTPERHFHAFGGPYPNPAVTGAAIAATTKNLSIRAGSCVSPLHHPIRIAEDWAVIDNLSNGRVGLSFASGWQPNDFVIKPENHKNNKAIMLEQIEMVRKLWRGEKVAFENPLGDMVEVTTLPRPVQKELPVWVTTAGNPETYKQAGIQGANVLTHLLGQTLDELAEKIELYRNARKEAGLDPDAGQVTLMLHTMVGDDSNAVREMVREPMKDYLRSSMKLVIDYAWSFPAFKRPRGEESKAEDIDIKSLSVDEMDTILDFAFERYFENSGLFGTPDECIDMVNRCKQAGIDEIACLLDYGVATDNVMNSLPYLKKVRDATNLVYSDESGFSFADQIARHKITHMQCTPSMARMLSLHPDTKDSLGKIDHLMIGGEALSASLAKDLLKLDSKSLTNMYGPTETTIWSTTQQIDAADPSVPIGRPIANTEIYILDKYRQPTPVGIPGELFIGGKGVVRGYLNRPELTSERFIPNPFSESENDRIYWTGDLACYRENGVIDFLGRIDHQVKIRGYRIELGEIESELDQHEGVHESVVILREDSPGDQRLVAYVVPGKVSVSTSELRDSLRRTLPDYMVPGEIVVLEALPLTPNKKIDRKALPAPLDLQPDRELSYAPPEGALEEKIVELWQNTLKVPKVGTSDNFFDLGGHSLLIVRLHTELQKVIDQPVSLMDLYRFPTIQSLVEYLNSGGVADSLKKSSDRAQRRREIGKKRRKRA